MSGELEPLGRNEMRASHEDRDHVVDRLRVAAGDGRIDAEELDQRIEAAMSARTYGELDVIVRDLPESAGTARRAPAHRPEDEASQTITVAHGRVDKYGPWLVPEKLKVSARHSSVTLDFTNAVFAGGHREVDIELDVAHSNVKLVLPEGSAIDDGLVARRHSNVSNRGFELADAGGVQVRLTGSAAHSNVRGRHVSERRQRLRLRRAERRRELGR